MSAPSFPDEELRERIRPRFTRALAGGGIYLANHSLGRPPDRMADDVAAALEAWYRHPERAWEHWLASREHFRALTARLVGAPRPDCIVPRASAGQGLRAVLNALPGRTRVLASDGEFDSLEVILQRYRDAGRIELATAPWRELDAHQSDLLVLSTVMFRSGEIVSDLPERIRNAQRAGARVLLDVYHHAGALPLDLAALDADFAVGGSYKYLRGGPGAAWLYLRPDLADSLRTLDTGWFATQQPFAWSAPRPARFAAGGDGWLESTPAVLAPIQALAGLEFTLEIGVERLRTHNLAQKRGLAALLTSRGLSPRGADEAHGAFVTLQHPRAQQLVSQLEARGVIVDARGDRLRLCPDLLNSAQDLGRAAASICDLAV